MDGQGPVRNIVFLVGMPRSGTKLLRNLMSRHPDVAIFPNESHFIPAFQRRAERYGDLTRPASFARLYADLSQTTFMRRLAGKGIRFEREELSRRLRGGELRHVLEAMFDVYAEMTGSSIVGDKTPEYILQIPLLSGLFPDARFVHVIRDPRDYVVSMRKAWGKSLPRAAHRWKTWIRRFHSDAERCRVRFIELGYEELIAAPRPTLERLCGFLGVDFVEDMLWLEDPVENLGDTQGASRIVAGNAGKWRHQLSEAEVRRVESIAGRLMAEAGYTPEYGEGDEDLGPLLLQLYRVSDGANLFRFGLREAGIGGAFSELRAATFGASREP